MKTELRKKILIAAGVLVILLAVYACYRVVMSPVKINGSRLTVTLPVNNEFWEIYSHNGIMFKCDDGRFVSDEEDDCWGCGISGKKIFTIDVLQPGEDTIVFEHRQYSDPVDQSLQTSNYTSVEYNLNVKAVEINGKLVITRASFRPA